jgi:hypothetical protein
MNYILNVRNDGSVKFTRHPSFVPPLGLTLPHGQDTSVTLPSGATLGAIFSSSSPSLPAGTQIIKGPDIYVYTGAYWMDSGTFTNANNVPISGLILIRNNSNYDIGITW